MNITIIGPGRLKESYLREACMEYEKRLSRYARVKIISVDDEPVPDQASEALMDQIRNREGERILKMVPSSGYVIALAIPGKQLSSEQFAGQIGQILVEGRSDLYFLIGGSIGLSRSCLERADLQLSFSKMTFPHQLMRVILLEQIYRAFRILHHEPYHK